MAALCRALKLHIRIAYLDGHSPDGQVHFQEITPPDGGKNEPLILIYRYVDDGLWLSQADIC